MANKKRILLTVLWVLIAAFLMARILSILKERTTVKSDYEAGLQSAGMNIVHLRARAPYVMFRPKPNVGVINSFGFASPEIARDKKPNEYRIAILGGSVAFNGKPGTSFTDPNATTIIADLARVLKAKVPELKDRDVTFINAGIPSAVSSQELAQLMYHVLPLDIDLLIIFDGFNDFSIPFNYDRRPGYPFDYIVEEYRYYKFIGEKKWWATFLSLFDAALLNKGTQQTIHDYYEELGIKRPTVEEGISQAFDIYFRNISYMLTVANAFGVKAAVFLQPYSPERNKVIPDRPETSALLKLYAMAGEKFQLLAKENSPDKIYSDMTYMGFGEIRSEFTDAAHFTENGNRLMAEEMYSVIKKDGMLK